MRRSGRGVAVWPLGRAPDAAPVAGGPGVIIVGRYRVLKEVAVHDHARGARLGQLRVLRWIR